MKTLLQITSEEEIRSAGIEIHCESEEDLFILCQGLYSLIKRNLTISAGLEAIMEMVKMKPDFGKNLVENVVEVPDFNELLKKTS